MFEQTGHGGTSWYLNMAFLPAVLVVLPVFLVVAVCLSPVMNAGQLLICYLALGISVPFIAKSAVDEGQEWERRFIATRGAQPGVIVLRYRDKGLDESLKRKVHQLLADTLGTPMPGRGDEEIAPGQADAAYRAGISRVVEAASGKRSFVLTRRALAYRLWLSGHVLRNAGLFTTCLAMAAICMNAYLAPVDVRVSVYASTLPGFFGQALILGIFATVWACLFVEQNVNRSAFAFAAQLVMMWPELKQSPQATRVEGPVLRRDWRRRY